MAPCSIIATKQLKAVSSIIVVDRLMFRQKPRRDTCRHQAKEAEAIHGNYVPQIAYFHKEDPDSHLIHAHLGPPESTCQTASPLVRPFLQSTSMLWTDAHTDHATTYISIGRICDMHTMRPNTSVEK